MLDEHDSDFEAQRVIHAHHDKGLPDCEIQTAPRGAPGMVVCVGSELGKDLRSEEHSLG